jgi:serine/threonine protein kinase
MLGLCQEAELGSAFIPQRDGTNTRVRARNLESYSGRVTPESEPRTIGPWTLGERLGEGGNAKVFRATRPGQPEEVALKIVNAKPLREP